MSQLILVRHGESAWNASGKIAGKADIPLTELGRQQAQTTAEKLADYRFDYTYSSGLQRALVTAEIITKRQASTKPILINSSLNERDFGSLTGKLKSTVLADLGEKTYKDIFSGWDTPAPDGESLKMTQERIKAFYTYTILPELKMGKTVLLVSHHHTLRALAKHIENLSVAEIKALKLPNAGARLYEFDSTGMLNKVILLD